MKNKVDVWLYRNPFSKEKEEYHGKVKCSGVLNNDDIADEMIKEGIEMQRETLIDILNRSDRLRVDKLLEGFQINTGMCQSQIRVKGVFESQVDDYDPNRHRIKISFKSAPVLVQKFKKMSVNVLGKAQTGPIIGKVKDITTGSENCVLSPGNALSVIGKNLKIVGKNDDVGIFLISKQSGAKLLCSTLIVNEPQTIIFKIPSLEKGGYILEIVTQYSRSNGVTKNSKSAQSNFDLRVN